MSEELINIFINIMYVKRKEKARSEAFNLRSSSGEGAKV